MFYNLFSLWLAKGPIKLDGPLALWPSGPLALWPFASQSSQARATRAYQQYFHQAEKTPGTNALAYLAPWCLKRFITSTSDVSLMELVMLMFEKLLLVSLTWQQELQLCGNNCMLSTKTRRSDHFLFFFDSKDKTTYKGRLNVGI
jgi:hypothetical protein